MPVKSGGDAKQIQLCVQDHMSPDFSNHKINGIVPRVSCERTPDSNLDYKVMGHVQKRVNLLRKRRGGEVLWTIEFNPLEKSLYVLRPDEPAVWLFTREGGVEEWGEQGLTILGMTREELSRGAPDL